MATVLAKARQGLRASCSCTAQPPVFALDCTSGSKSVTQRVGNTAVKELPGQRSKVLSCAPAAGSGSHGSAAPNPSSCPAACCSGCMRSRCTPSVSMLLLPPLLLLLLCAVQRAAARRPAPSRSS